MLLPNMVLLQNILLKHVVVAKHVVAKHSTSGLGLTFNLVESRKGSLGFFTTTVRPQEVKKNLNVVSLTICI